jgi:AMIN domain
VLSDVTLRKGRRATILDQTRRRPGLILGIALLVAATIAAVPALAQSAPPGAMQPAHVLPAKVTSPPRIATVRRWAVLRNVSVLRGKTSVEVYLEASGTVKPVARMFSQPERIVVDLAGVSYDGSRHLPVNAGGVEGVRVALFKVDPPVTRVVVDLGRRHQYRLKPAGRTVVLAIDTSPKPTIAAQPATKVTTGTAAKATPRAAATPPASKTAPVQAPVSVAKLPPPMAKPQPPARPPARPVATIAAQPSTPTVVTALPKVATITVPSNSVPAPAALEEEATTPHQAAKDNRPGLVRSVTVLRGKDAIEVHIEGTRPLRASASTLSHPERIIVDLANVRLNQPRRIQVHSADVQDVDCALYLVNPLVTRVVVNLAHAHPYHLLSYGNSLIVKIETDEVKTAGSQPVR